MEHVWWRTHLRRMPEGAALGLGGLQLGNFAEVDDYMPFLTEVLDLPARGRVLEVGSGRGSFSIRLAQWGYTVTAVEESQALVAHAWDAARERGVELELRHADPRALADRSAFDGALILDFGASSDMDNAAVMRAVVTALRPGGKVVFGACNPYFWARDARTEHRTVERADIIRRYSFDFQAGALVSRVRCILQDGRRLDLPPARYRAYTLPELRALTASVQLSDLQIWGQSEGGAPRPGTPPDSLRTPYFHCVAARPVSGEGGDGI